MPPQSLRIGALGARGVYCKALHADILHRQEKAVAEQVVCEEGGTPRSTHMSISMTRAVGERCEFVKFGVLAHTSTEHMLTDMLR